MLILHFSGDFQQSLFFSALLFEGLTYFSLKLWLFRPPSFFFSGHCYSQNFGYFPQPYFYPRCCIPANLGLFQLPHFYFLPILMAAILISSVFCLLGGSVFLHPKRFFFAFFRHFFPFKY